MERYSKAISISCGTGAAAALWIYRAILLLRLAYETLVRWPRRGTTETKNLLYSLEVSHLRAAEKAMRTLTEVLKIAVDIPLLDLTVVKLATNTAYRLYCQGE
ncbi:hypothetical protein KM043_017052 [Ampulex compressa]|nr:hypothetical protein KM043_017052 [Ampulex compressa]